MKKYSKILGACAAALGAAILVACEKTETIVEPLPETREEPAAFISLEEVAGLLSSLPLERDQLEEVHDAARASAGNGYDEEYRMQDLFSTPGAGVGDDATKAGKTYRRPLRDLLREAVQATRSAETEPEAWLDSLCVSDVQIYWPFSDSWDGESLPVVTFDPGDGAERNVGYALRPDGSVEKVMVDEKMAAEQPVWVVNRNSDADYKSLELRRREDPSWGQGGGDVLIRPTKADAGDIKTLVLRSFKAKRQFDSWLAGASEYVVRMGSVEDFRASTEAELRLYQPSVTDFMIVVRRNQVGEVIPFNAVLVSEWTEQLQSCAFMVTEDDGGTRTTWKAAATVKYNSKQYGIEVELPLNQRDDIVWRGSLTRAYIERYNGRTAGYGDVELVLELI